MDIVTIEGKQFQLCLTQQQIEKRISELAIKIQAEYEKDSPLFIVILNGAFMFATEFLKNYTSECQIEFVKLMSYVGNEASGEVVSYIGLPEHVVSERRVIILEDIVDSGRTMEYFVEHLQELYPKSIEVVSLLFKPDCLVRDINLNHYGFSLDSAFVIGYGLDYNYKGRNLTNIYQAIH